MTVKIEEKPVEEISEEGSVLSTTISIDTGGTFTDVVILDENGGIYFDKAFSSSSIEADSIIPKPPFGFIFAFLNLLRYQCLGRQWPSSFLTIFY